jgi:hypothetical protein
MVKIDNIYFNISEDDYQLFRDTIDECYKDRERIRMIMDLEGKEVSLRAFKKIKKVFDDLGVEKLEETCVLCKDGIKKNLIKRFIKLIPTKRPVKFL